MYDQKVQTENNYTLLMEWAKLNGGSDSVSNPDVTKILSLSGYNESSKIGNFSIEN